MVRTRRVELKTSGNGEVIDITPHIVRELGATTLKNGTVTVFVTGSTAGVTTIEFEPGLLSDFKAMWDRVVPGNIFYRHDTAHGGRATDSRTFVPRCLALR